MARWGSENGMEKKGRKTAYDYTQKNKIDNSVVPEKEVIIDFYKTFDGFVTKSVIQYPDGARAPHNFANSPLGRAAESAHISRPDAAACVPLRALLAHFSHSVQV
jgi:hypothetical protein